MQSEPRATIWGVTPATGTALILLVAFVLPGFITVLFQERTFESPQDTTPLDRLLRAVYYSLWCYLLLMAVALIFGLDRAWAEALVRRHQDDPAQLAWRAALALLAPATAVWLATLLWQETGAKAWLLRKLKLNARHRQPAGWDFWFRQGYKTYVKIVFADGHTVWGFYGENSFASYAKDGRDLYLEYLLPEDKIEDETSWFGAWNEDNRGVWVNLEDAIHVEFYSPGDANSAAEEGGGAEARGTGGAHQGAAQASAASAAPAPPKEGMR